MSGLLDSLATFVYHFVPDVQTCQVLGATNKNPGGLGPRVRGKNMFGCKEFEVADSGNSESLLTNSCTEMRYFLPG